jgi:hypothetical protein
MIMQTKVELVKETRADEVFYWVKIDDKWSYCFIKLQEAEEKYQKILLGLIPEYKTEILKSTTI